MGKLIADGEFSPEIDRKYSAAYRTINSLYV